MLPERLPIYHAVLITQENMKLSHQKCVGTVSGIPRKTEYTE